MERKNRSTKRGVQLDGVGSILENSAILGRDLGCGLVSAHIAIQRELLLASGPESTRTASGPGKQE